MTTYDVHLILWYEGVRIGERNIEVELECDGLDDDSEIEDRLWVTINDNILIDIDSFEEIE